MALVLGVNSYANDLEGDFYFENRIDATQWTAPTVSVIQKEMALTTATNLIEQMRFAGYASTGTQALAWPRVGSFEDIGRGRTIQFTGSFDMATSDSWTNPSGTETAEGLFAALPREIQLLKIATMEQALHLLSNDNLLDTPEQGSLGNLSSIQVGSIQLEYAGSSGATEATVPVQSSQLNRFLRPLLQGGGSNLWFRAN